MENNYNLNTTVHLNSMKNKVWDEMDIIKGCNGSYILQDHSIVYDPLKIRNGKQRDIGVCNKRDSFTFK